MGVDEDIKGADTVEQRQKSLQKKLQLTGRTLGRVFKSRSVCMLAKHLPRSAAKRPNLELKTRPKQFLDYFLLVTTVHYSRVPAEV